MHSSWDAQELVPERVCGPVPRETPAAAFFQRFTTNAALDLAAIHVLHEYVGCAQYPSGWIASPWMVHPDLTELRRELGRCQFQGEPSLE